MNVNWRRRVSIRAKLMLLVLAMLLIPWMGYKYVREVKVFLQHGQEDALLLTARAVSTVFHDRTELFNPQTGVPEILGDESDLYAHQLARYLQIDGDPEDWGEQISQLQSYTGDRRLACTADYDPESLGFSQLLGYRNQFLYSLLIVTDSKPVFRDPTFRRLDNSDHVRLTVQDPGGQLRRYVLTARKPGRMSIYQVDDDWRYPISGDPIDAITAVRADTDGGYNVEVRIPRYMLSAQTGLAFAVADVDDSEKREVEKIITTMPEVDSESVGRLLLHSPEIAKILHGLDKPDARIWILDSEQRVRAVVGSLSSGGSAPRHGGSRRETQSWVQQQLSRLFELVLESPAEQFEDISPQESYRREEIFHTALTGSPVSGRRPSLDRRAEIIMAAQPIWSGNKVLGAVVVEQSNNELLALQRAALQDVATVTVLVFLFVTAALLIFASRLTLRISRLRNTTESAITPEGRVRRDRIETEHEAGDEIGDLSRSISSMLNRLTQYTRYLEGMPDTLAHELRNPLNVVNSSLDNLHKEVPEANSSKYMERAQNGINRLRSILTNLTEAANLEDALRDEARERINLADLVSSYVEGYRLSHPHHDFDLQIQDKPLLIDGSPDQIAQMLDKLADNALDFSSKGSPISVNLKRLDGSALISVANHGPSLPKHMRERLFDPMISVGKTNAKQSHLGLGLYVVRLIAEFHNGTVQARNRGDDQGAVVTVALPLVRQ